MSLSKKKRFEVFKRDSFTCQYCGATPPKVILELDHIHPISKGGNDEIDNLVTACFDCNRGKSNIELSSVPESIAQKSETIQEKELQYKEFKKLLSSVKRRKTKEAKRISKIYNEYYEGWILTDKFLKGSVSKFIDNLGVDQVEDNAYKAFSYISDPDEGIRYFCGICWNQIKER